jgi:hypothetical protein
LIDYTGEAQLKSPAALLGTRSFCFRDAFFLSFLPKVGRELGEQASGANGCSVAFKVATYRLLSASVAALSLRALLS